MQRSAFILALLICARAGAPDGACGHSWGVSCPNQLCCSMYGYCGASPAYCGTGCQASFGACSGNQSTPNPSSSPVPAAPGTAPAGACGALRGAACPNQLCCSAAGFCGSGAAYCGIGCQSAFGTCSGVQPSPHVPQPTSSPTTGSTAPAGACGAPWGIVCPNQLCCSAAGYCGSGAAYCSAGCQGAFGVCEGTPQSPRSPQPTVSPVPLPSPVSPKTGPAALTGFVFGAYKDATVNMNWNTAEISTGVTGTVQPITEVVPAGTTALTWAFATGECGTETFGGYSSAVLAAANVPQWVASGQKYIISTGGAAGIFTCESDAGFSAFIEPFVSPSLVGFDFDIEGSQTQTDIDRLVQRVQAAMVAYPNLRWSWTLATLGGPSGDNMGFAGQMVMRSLKKYNLGWERQFINLMTMDYGDASVYTCAVVNGQCDMGQSAINAAETLHAVYGVPYNRIELTPMIGGNDVKANVFTLADAATVANYVRSRGLGGLHYWSLDRDTDCPAGNWASPTCNSYGTAGPLGFTNAFLRALALP